MDWLLLVLAAGMFLGGALIAFATYDEQTKKIGNVGLLILGILISAIGLFLFFTALDPILQPSY